MDSITALLARIFPPALHDRLVLVGGTVRDHLIGQNCQDVDLVAALAPVDLRALGFRLVESSSSAAIFFRHHPDCGKIEITCIDHMDALVHDLCRRDFTVNAMAMTLDGTLIDPLGGRDDLQACVLRACSGLTFSSDPLRIFRAFRFEADGWRMTRDTAGLIKERDWSAACGAMPVERFSGEMLKALAQRAPERFFQLMIEYNVGESFLPELFRMVHVPAGPREHHPEGDLFTHAIQVLQQVAAMTAEPLSRFCAFFHDLGKLSTDQVLYPCHHGHESAGATMAKDFCRRLRLPALYGVSLAGISRLHGTANRWPELRVSTKVTMAEQAIRGRIAQILPFVSAADKPGGLPAVEWDAAVRVAGMTIRELGIEQHVLVDMPTGQRAALIMQKRVEALRAALVAVASQPVDSQADLRPGKGSAG